MLCDKEFRLVVNISGYSITNTSVYVLLSFILVPFLLMLLFAGCMPYSKTEISDSVISVLIIIKIHFHCRLFSRYTMTVIADTMFGMKISALDNKDDKFFANAKSLMELKPKAMFMMALCKLVFGPQFPIFGIF